MHALTDMEIYEAGSRALDRFDSQCYVPRNGSNVFSIGIDFQEVTGYNQLTFALDCCLSFASIVKGEGLKTIILYLVDHHGWPESDPHGYTANRHGSHRCDRGLTLSCSFGRHLAPGDHASKCSQEKRFFLIQSQFSQFKKIALI